MDTTALVLVVVALAAESALLVVLLVLWLRGRRAQRKLRAELADLQERPPRRPPCRLVPTPDEAVKAVWETVDRVREKGLGGAFRSSIDDLAGWAQVERPELVKLAGPDGRVAIFFPDIEGSTELNERLGDSNWVRLLARHDSAVLRHRAARGAGGQDPGRRVHGRVRLARTGGPQRGRDPAGLRARSPEEDPAAVLVRIGIHYGDVVHRDNDIFGRNVAHAAASPRWPRAARSWSATAWPTRSPTAKTSRWPTRARCSSRDWPATTRCAWWNGRPDRRRVTRLAGEPC